MNRTHFRTIARIAAATALALVLAGCWSAANPLFPSAQQVKPPINGFYAQTGTEEALVHYRVANRGNDAVVELKNSEGAWVADRTLNFVQIGSGFYIGQSFFEGSYEYFVLITRADGFDILIPSCTDEIKASQGVNSSDEYCNFTSFTALQREAGKLVRAYKDGDTSGVYETRTYAKE